jgi:hypothetical protein
VLWNLLFEAWQSDRSALQPYESGVLGRTPADSGAPVTVNYVSQPVMSRDGPGFTYWTGGLSRGKRPLSPPTRVAAVARQGLTRVELKADARASNHPAVAEAVARQIDVATRLFWPTEQMPVAVELHLVPEDSRYEFARKITWREGRPFHLTMFIAQTVAAQRQADTALHELYHVLAARWRLGAKSQRGIASPWLGSLYEEVAASLLADCGRLQVADRVALPENKMTVTLNGANGAADVYRGSLDAEGLTFMLAPERNFTFPPGLVTDLLHRTALLAFVTEGDAIVAGSDPARHLMALCREATRDPWYLEDWFRGLADRRPSR